MIKKRILFLAITFFYINLFFALETNEPKTFHCTEICITKIPEDLIASLQSPDKELCINAAHNVTKFIKQALEEQPKQTPEQQQTIEKLSELIDSLQSLTEKTRLTTTDSNFFTEKFNFNQKITLETNFKDILTIPQLSNNTGEIIYSKEKSAANDLYICLDILENYTNNKNHVPLETITITNENNEPIANLFDVITIIINTMAAQQRSFLKALNNQLKNIDLQLALVHDWYEQIAQDALKWDAINNPDTYNIYIQRINGTQELLRSLDTYFNWIENDHTNGILQAHHKIMETLPKIVPNNKINCSYLTTIFPEIRITIHALQRTIHGCMQDGLRDEMTGLFDLHKKVLTIINDKKYFTTPSTQKDLSELAAKNIQNNYTALELFATESNGRLPDIIQKNTPQIAQEENNFLNKIYEHIALFTCTYKHVKDLLEQPQITLNQETSIDTVTTAMQQTINIVNEITQSLSKELISHEFIMQHLQNKEVKNLLKNSFFIVPAWIYTQQKKSAYDPLSNCFNLYDLIINVISLKRITMANMFIKIISDLVEKNEKVFNDAYNSIHTYLNLPTLILNDIIPDQQKINQLCTTNSIFIEALADTETIKKNSTYIQNLNLKNYPPWGKTVINLSAKISLNISKYKKMYQELQNLINHNKDMLAKKLELKDLDNKNNFFGIERNTTDMPLLDNLIKADQPTKNFVLWYWNKGTPDQRRNFCYLIFSTKETCTNLKITLTNIIEDLHTLTHLNINDLDTNDSIAAFFGLTSSTLDGSFLAMLNSSSTDRKVLIDYINTLSKTELSTLIENLKNNPKKYAELINTLQEKSKKA
jgi:hypothetical protein